MKLKNGFILRTVVGQNIALFFDGVTSFDRMITLNGTARFLWEMLDVGAEKQQLVDALLEEYDVERERAEKSVDSFIKRLEELGCLE